MVDVLNYFSFQAVLQYWCNKGCGMAVCGMMHIKASCGSCRFPLSLSEWSFTICLTPYNCKWNVLCASLNRTFPSFLLNGQTTSIIKCKLLGTYDAQARKIHQLLGVKTKITKTYIYPIINLLHCCQSHDLTKKVHNFLIFLQNWSLPSVWDTWSLQNWNT